MRRTLMACILSAGTLFVAAAASAGPSPYTPPSAKSSSPYRFACTLGPSGYATIRNVGRMSLRPGQAVYVTFREKSGAETRPRRVQVYYPGLPVNGTMKVALNMTTPETITSCIVSSSAGRPRLSL